MRRLVLMYTQWDPRQYQEFVHCCRILKWRKWPRDLPRRKNGHLWRDAKLILWQASTFYISPARYCHLGVLAFMFLLVVWLMSYLFHCPLWVPNTCLFFYLLMLIYITNVCILSALILDNMILARTLFLSYRNTSKLSMLLFRLKLHMLMCFKFED